MSERSTKGSLKANKPDVGGIYGSKRVKTDAPAGGLEGLPDEEVVVEEKAIKKDAEPVKTLVGFLDRFLVRKGKILSGDKKVFDKLEIDLNEENKLRLVNQFNEQDKELKYCLALSEFLLEGSSNSSVRAVLLDFIERVLSDYSLFSEIKNNSVLQIWLQGSDGVSDKLKFFHGQFTSLKGQDSEGEEQGFTDRQISTLLCITAVWLYFKKESDFTRLTRYLSHSAFSTKGQSSDLIESQAFAFATSMISSTKKMGFAYFLQKVSETEKDLFRQLQGKSDECNDKSSKIFTLSRTIDGLETKSSLLNKDNEKLVDRVGQLERDLVAQKEKARHGNTHHEDGMDALRVRLRHVLEGELKGILENAKTAHSKGKHAVVEYQIDDALEILKRELKRVESNA